MKTNLTIFLTGFMQVFLVGANTYFISRTAYSGMAICGFGISYLWTINVKKTAISTHWQRVSYSTGAAIGGILGVIIAQMLRK
jgi:hypothetical protein